MRSATEQRTTAGCGRYWPSSRVAPADCSGKHYPAPVTATPSDQPLTDAAVVDRLGEDLRASGYDADGVPELLGDSAHRALGRGELAPALRATRDRSPLATLTRLFLLGATEDEQDIATALPRTGIADALDQGVLERDGGLFRAALDIRPHAGGRPRVPPRFRPRFGHPSRPGTAGPRARHRRGVDHAGQGGHSAARRPGVGCGNRVRDQALHLAAHANSVVATDVNPRALALAAATARLNGQRWDLRAGSLFEPVDGEDFDLIVCNPPFVISDGEMRYSYRDSGLAGDESASGSSRTSRPICEKVAPRNCSPTGLFARTPTGAKGSAPGWPPAVWTPGWCSAKWPTPQSMSGYG